MLNTDYEKQILELQRKRVELKVKHDKELANLGYTIDLILNLKSLPNEIKKILENQNLELEELDNLENTIFENSTKADKILYGYGAILNYEDIKKNRKLLIGDKNYRPVVSKLAFKNKGRFIFNDKALSNIHNQVVIKRAKNQLSIQNKQEELSNKTLKTKHNKIVDSKSLEEFNKKFEVIKQKTFEKTIMKYIKDYIDNGYMPLFITMTLNPNHNITEEDIENNIDISKSLEKQYNLFIKFITNFYERVNEALKRNSLERVERITVNEATKKLNTHLHSIFLVKKEGLAAFIRLLFSHWDKQENINRLHIEPILDYEYFDEVVKTLSVRQGAKKLLFENIVDYGKNKVLVEKETGNQIFYTKPNKNSDIQNVGSYVFKYVMKEDKFAGDELFPKKIDTTVVKTKLLQRDRDKLLKIFIREYKKSFYLTRLHLADKMNDIFKDIESIHVNQDIDISDLELTEDNIFKAVRLREEQKQLNKQLEELIIDQLIKNWEEYSYENYKKDNSLYSALRKLEYIEATGILHNDEVIGWLYYIYMIEDNEDLIRENYFTKIGNYEETSNQSKFVQYKDKDKKYLDLLKEKASIENPNTAILQNQLNIYITDFTNPYQAKLSQKNRNILRSLDTNADYQTKIMNKIEENINIIDAIEVIGEKKEISIYDKFNGSLDLDNVFSSKLIDINDDTQIYIQQITKYFKIEVGNNVDYDIVFLTYTNKIRQDINKLFQKYTNDNEPIGETGFKLFDKIIYTDNDLYYMGITKNDMFKIVKVHKDRVFLKNIDTNEISIFPLKILNNKFDLAYCITIHNSQGQSFNNICVIQQDLKGFDIRLLYVAISRAKNKLITIFSYDLIKKLELITGDLHIRHKDKKVDFDNNILDTLSNMNINEQLKSIKDNLNQLLLNDFKQYNIFQSSKIKYKDIKNIEVPTTDKIIEYTGWYGFSLYNENNETILNNYLISEFKHNQNFGVHREVLIQLGFEIPSRYDNQNIIVATGIKEHYESVLKKLCDRKNIDTNYELKTQIDNKGFHFKQIEFVKKALKSGFTILTGEGGTGKTHTIKELYDNLILNGVDNEKIQFTAPTNSACKVIQKNIPNANVSTIHKIADIDANMNKRRTNIVNSFEYVIVDEVSMLDYKLLNELLLCLDNNTRLILVGDYNQLPPVNGISVLEDVIELCNDNHIDLIYQFRATTKILSDVYKMIRNLI